MTRYSAGMTGPRAEQVIAMVRHVLKGATFTIHEPSDPQGMATRLFEDLRELDERGLEGEEWQDAASFVVGAWLMAAVSADLRAEGGLHLVDPDG